MTAFLEGVARALDIGAVFPRRKQSDLTAYTNDYYSSDKTIAKYWGRVGYYLGRAVEGYEYGQKETNSASE
jgi:hypothetical protein